MIDAMGTQTAIGRKIKKKRADLRAGIEGEEPKQSGVAEDAHI